MIYKAQALIVECKTGTKGKKSKTVRDVTTVASSIGHRFVGKFLITSLFTNQIDPKRHADIQHKAEKDHTFVITGEELPRVKEFLVE
ncbi:hypothetical protein [Thermosporothrix hazakensis]|jgi:hypothetical protein|uniref:hypothetical protein n=1 Tax=Thermosporothrix hazakensis TaxID=644383 RepID=UPI000DABC0D6|nr:hypothetical protein [Thermosporothrix hazakensis]GCE46983.1 hypothetical protein KTH_18520 [Thermosporothrix hazakensis]